MFGVSVPFRGFRGLQGVGNQEVAADAAGVSVPFRGFRGLQVRSCHSGTSATQCVSVPFRGFRGLQGGPRNRQEDVSNRGFSPLPGFQGSAGRALRKALKAKPEVVSVPFRGFRGLQGHITHESLEILQAVSVPFRGFRGLQVVAREPRGGNVLSVSVPFRGFRGLQATTISRRRDRTGKRFSPLPGFQGSAGADCETHMGGVIVLPLPVSSFLVHSSACFFGAPCRNHHFPTVCPPGFRNSANPPKMASSCGSIPDAFLMSVICHLHATTISTARSCALALSCFGRVAKRPRESALFEVSAESRRVLRLGKTRTPALAQSTPVGFGGARTSDRTHHCSAFSRRFAITK